MDQRLREALDKIDDVMEEYADERNAIATVLRAMRGPDNENEGAKYATTTIIRQVAFPKSGIWFGTTRDDVSTIPHNVLEGIFTDPTVEWHFAAAMKSAA